MRKRRFEGAAYHTSSTHMSKIRKNNSDAAIRQSTQ
jgi:hypothetical protein